MAGRVLIVDDEPDVARYLAAVLEAHGYRTSVAHSVESGVEAIKAELPDLVCLDIMMPQESGISLYRKLRESEDTRTIPVLFVSGAEQEEKFDFRTYLPDESIPEPEGYLEKPIDIGKYVELVRSLTELKPPEQGERD